MIISFSENKLSFSEKEITDIIQIWTENTNQPEELVQIQLETVFEIVTEDPALSHDPYTMRLLKNGFTDAGKTITSIFDNTEDHLLKILADRAIFLQTRLTETIGRLTNPPIEPDRKDNEPLK